MNKISVLTKNSTDSEQLGGADRSELSFTPGEGAAAGAVIGATIGGSLALVAGLAALLVPGVGQALAVESLLVTFAAGGASAAAGGLVGAVRGWFLPEEPAIFHNHQVSPGIFIVTVSGTQNELRRAEPILTRWGIQDWRVYDALN